MCAVSRRTIKVCTARAAVNETVMVPTLHVLSVVYKYNSFYYHLSMTIAEVIL